MEDINKERYERMWRTMDVQKPEIWSTWKIIKDFKGKNCLEIGPGKYPRIPVKGNSFVDISQEAINNLKTLGAKAFVGTAESLFFADNSFDLVVAADVLEHLDNDQKALSEIVRVLKPSGFFLLSVPLNKKLYGEMDVIAGHKKRYEIQELINLLSKNNFKIIKYRSLSFYLRIQSIWARVLGFTKVCSKIYQNKEAAEFFHLPKFLVNLTVKGFAFFDRIMAPSWQENTENLRNYQDEWIMLFCEKIIK